MAMADKKWKGKTTAEVKGITVDQVWSLLSDFCNLQKCMPEIEVCVKVEGEDGKPGLVRHVGHRVKTTSDEEQPPLSGDDNNVGIWAREKLMIIDETERYLRYELIDNNIGIKLYEASFRVVEVEAGGASVIEWSYIADPVDGMTIEDFDVNRGYLLRAMVEKIQAHDFSLLIPIPISIPVRIHNPVSDHVYVPSDLSY